MHDPISSAALGRLPSVENQSFLHPHSLVAHNLFVQAGRLPVAGGGGPVGPAPVGVLNLFSAEEIPLLLGVTCGIA